MKIPVGANHSWNHSTHPPLGFDHRHHGGQRYTYSDTRNESSVNTRPRHVLAEPIARKRCPACAHLVAGTAHCSEIVACLAEGFHPLHHVDLDRGRP